MRNLLLFLLLYPSVAVVAQQQPSQNPCEERPLSQRQTTRSDRLNSNNNDINFSSLNGAQKEDNHANGFIAMSRLARRSITVSILVALALSVTAYVIYERIQTGIAASVEHKSAKSTTATVVSVTEAREGNPPDADSRSQLYKICFTIDNFNQVEADVRQGYQSAEVERLARDGPRCISTSKVALAKNLKKGTRLTVVYLLENQYHIDLVATTVFGQDLTE